MAYPAALEALVDAFERFPGIGRRTAERLAFHILRDPSSRALSRAIEDAVARARRCGRCCNVAESDPCPLCADPDRDDTLLCVVEEPRHVEAMERSAAFKGRYHVLMGSYNPAEGSEPRHLTLAELVRRVGEERPREVILATDPDQEGEATACLVSEALRSALPEETGSEAGPRITRLARGLPAGSAIEYLHRGVLEDALAGLRPV